MPTFIVSRRVLARAMCLSPFALLACSTNPLTQPVTVDLTTAQIWAGEVSAAVNGFVLAMDSAVPPATAAVVNKANITLQAANAAFQALKSGSANAQQLVAEVSQQVQAVMSALAPIYPAVQKAQTDIDLGLMVLNAFVAAVAIVVPPVPASLHRAALSGRGRR